jgi:diguanylate cyclase (GGDEF)-like protein
LRLDYEPGGDPAGIKMGLAVPMRVAPVTEPEVEAEPEARSETIGLLSIFTRSDRGPFSEGEARELEELGRRAAPRISDAFRLYDAERRAVIDAQTGLYNKARFHEVLASEVRRAERHRRPLALLTFDLDDFKAINEQYGHLRADEVVTEIARRLKDCRVRQEDIACRTGGGDEFAVILPESTIDGAVRFYERLQAAIAAQPVIHVGTVLLSAGIAELWAETHESDLAFLTRAYEARAQAKRCGKGRMAAAVTLAQAVQRVGFTIWAPQHVSPEWTTQITHLPSSEQPPATETVLITYASAAEGGVVLSLAERQAAGGEAGSDAEQALTVDRAGTAIRLESATASAEWLTGVAETLVAIPVEPPAPSDEPWTLPPVAL